MHPVMFTIKFSLFFCTDKLSAVPLGLALSDFKNNPNSMAGKVFQNYVTTMFEPVEPHIVTKANRQLFYVQYPPVRGALKVPPNFLFQVIPVDFKKMVDMVNDHYGEVKKKINKSVDFKVTHKAQRSRVFLFWQTSVLVLKLF